MTRPGRSRAFSLVELLLVIGILAIVLAFLVPAADQALRGSTLTQSGQMVEDLIATARQFAVAQNRSIFVRFYKLPGSGVDEDPAFTAVQLMAQEEDGTLEPLSRVNRLHENVVISDSSTYSPLITNARDKGADTVVGRSAEYASFRFLPDGSTDLSATAPDGWFLTLMNRGPLGGDGEVPENFYTIRVSPHTGHTRVFRP